MTPQSKIALPRSVLATYYGRARCPKHDVGVNQECLLFAGIGRAPGGALCLAVEWQCIVCQKPHRAVLQDHGFTRIDWWNELAEWHADGPSAKQSVIERRAAWHMMPKIGPIVLDMAGLESAWIRGGYKGEVGPIMLVFEGTEPNSMAGVLRLERNTQVSLFHDTDLYCLPRHRVAELWAIDDGGSFSLDGHRWIKMSVSEIEEIIRDRVFAVPVDDVLVSTPRRKPRGGHGNAKSAKSRKGTRRPPRDSGPMDS